MADVVWVVFVDEREAEGLYDVHVFEKADGVQKFLRGLAKDVAGDEDRGAIEDLIDDEDFEAAAEDLAEAHLTVTEILVDKVRVE